MRPEFNGARQTGVARPETLSRRIAVTGGEGFMGWHLRCATHANGNLNVQCLGRPEMESAEIANAKMAGAEAVIHLAGVNRGTGEEVEMGNFLAAKQLAQALRLARFKGRLVFASTIHADQDSPYGRGKRVAQQILQEQAEQHGWRLTTVLIPHVYGEHGRPFYNSAVATFAHSIVNKLDCEVNRAGQLELVYVGDVVRRLIEEACDGESGRNCRLLRIHGQILNVGSVFDLLAEQWRQYSRDEIPDLRNDLQVHLFNTLRAAAFPNFYPRPYTLKRDPRGTLAEVVRAHGGGQVFYSLTEPGVTRGNHYHYRKVERFAVLQGQARIELRRLFSDACYTFDVNGAEPAYVDMPALHTHSITNVGTGPLLTLFWAHEFFDPEAPDTVAEPVRRPS